jgi:hypothetical protein
MQFVDQRLLFVSHSGGGVSGRLSLYSLQAFDECLLLFGFAAFPMLMRQDIVQLLLKL